MSKNRGNFENNYPQVIIALELWETEYYEYNDGQHLKILGTTRYVELWPSRMTFHIIESEIPTSTSYGRLSFNFRLSELDNLLNGTEHL